MMNVNPDEGYPTVRVFSRTLQEAFPKDYLNEGIFEGPYRDPQISDLAILFALIAIISFAVYMFNYYM